ncbi:XkdW family protein [Bradyrhizobium sp. C-145]|uniref:XkdW family protein n=1 Tax=Bradyrhizobium sp. C-145 TaxID=574727 RepID=UPI00201B7CF0|nr:XkdW family protein [Bradyrhizobium sp. C-145]UQR66230.1 XkdW family protein [Bradyrhizobium sp. C-145]
MAFNQQFTVLAIEHLTGLKNMTDFEVADRGNGIPVITAWHSTTVQPTQAQIEAVDTDALLNPPVSKPPRVVAAALNIGIADGNITSLDGAFNIAGAIYFDVGQYMLLFIEPQPDNNYFALITGDAPVKRVSDAQVDSFTIECKDAVSGNGIDPANLSVQVMRIDQ